MNDRQMAYMIALGKCGITTATDQKHTDWWRELKLGNLIDTCGSATFLTINGISKVEHYEQAQKEKEAQD